MARFFKVVSCVVHALVIAVVSYSQIFSPGILPTPRSALAYEFQPAVVRDIPPPAPAPRDRAAAPATNPNLAPISPPDDIRPETGHEQDPPIVRSGVVDGIERGAGAIADLGLPGFGLPPPPPPSPREPVRLHKGMQEPRKIVNVDPVYPQLAQVSRKEGVVILEAVIDATGGVESVRVLRSIPLLDQAAVTAVQKWRFTPALLNGQPVPVVMTITVNFQLTK